VDEQISLGDFVLSGGEIAAMALLDAVARLQPGVLNDAGSHQQDSFNPALTACWIARTTPGLRNGRGRVCLRCCCQATRQHRALAARAAAENHRATPP